jgi:uncharacterized protein YceH (UPF0502 family)
VPSEPDCYSSPLRRWSWKRRTGSCSIHTNGRVIGTLIEKGLSTPQAYPLSLNALTTGCNQRNNREPITNFTDEQVEEIAQRLQARGLVSVVHPATGRVYRYRQEFGRNYEMRRAELAVLGELLLRGAQTEGELRQRASRMENIATLDDPPPDPEWLAREDPIVRGPHHAGGELRAAWCGRTRAAKPRSSTN